MSKEEKEKMKEEIDFWYTVCKEIEYQTGLEFRKTILNFKGSGEEFLTLYGKKEGHILIIGMNDNIYHKEDYYRNFSISTDPEACKVARIAMVSLKYGEITKVENLDVVRINGADWGTKQKLISEMVSRVVNYLDNFLN